MKKMISVLLALLLCLSLLAGCTQNDEEKAQFDFSYSVEKTKYARGETIQITATVTNVSGRTYRYIGCSGNDFIPFISLYNEIDGEKHYIECDPIVLPADVVNKKVKNGESGSIVNTFVIPEDAMLGNYTLTLSLGEDKKEFADILSIVELTTQNENEKYSYSSAIISSGHDNIKPITVSLFAEEYSQSGESLFCADGMGSDGVFSDPETNISDFPTIVADRAVTATPSAYSNIGNPCVYNINYEENDQYSHPGWNGLHLLPAGEYIVVFYEKTDSRNTNSESETYWITRYENIFRLIVPEREVGDTYYSLTFNRTYPLADDYNIDTKYRAGERVELKLELVTEQYYEVIVGDERAVMIGNEDTYVIYAFIMPAGDAHVQIKTVDVDIPSAP